MDRDLLRRLWLDYYRDAEGADTDRTILRSQVERAVARLERPDVVGFLDSEAGRYCQLGIGQGEIEVEAWLPRGVSRGSLAPVLAGALRAVRARDARFGAYRVYGMFKLGKDAQGRPDNGRGIAEAWRAFFGQRAGRRIVEIRTNAEGLAEPYATLDDLLWFLRRHGH